MDNEKIFSDFLGLRVVSMEKELTDYILTYSSYPFD
jgi:hypothetical protein